MKNPFLIDVDGVLANFSGHVLRSVGSVLNEHAIRSWNIFGYLNDAQRGEVFDLMRDPEWWEMIPAYLGAKTWVDALRKEHGAVLFVTSPWYSCDGWEAARRAWLGAVVDAAPDEMIATPHKHLIHGAGLIDDKPEHVEAWAAAHPTGRALLYDAPYNRHATHLERVHGVDLLRAASEAVFLEV